MIRPFWAVTGSSSMTHCRPIGLKLFMISCPDMVSVPLDTASEITNIKKQITNNTQYLKFKNPNMSRLGGCWNYCHWKLEFGIYLGFDVWDL
jgi:hypothetical protein